MENPSWNFVLLITTLAILCSNIDAASLKTQPNPVDAIPSEDNPNECKTTSGKTCKLPFVWKGKLYKTCTEDEHTGPWCSTLVDSSNVHVTGEWDDCSSSCTKHEMEPQERSSILEKAKEVNVENDNNKVRSEDRSAQAFSSNFFADTDKIAPQLVNEDQLKPGSAEAFQHGHPKTNYNPRFGQPMSTERIENLFSLIKELCSLVGSCQQYPNHGCQFDIRGRSYLPIRSGYGPPMINPFQFSSPLQNRYDPIQPKPSPIQFNPNLNQNKDSKEEDYSYFSSTFEDLGGWGQDGDERSLGYDFAVKPEEFDNEGDIGMEDTFHLSNEVNYPQESLEIPI